MRFFERSALSERQYYYLATGEEDTFGRSDNVLSPPWWPEAAKWRHEKGNERVEPPMLFTSREGAEAQLHDFDAGEPENYLKLVEQVGEEKVNEALDHTTPLRVFGINETRLLGLLESSDFLTIKVDGQWMFREDFANHLQGSG